VITRSGKTACQIEVWVVGCQVNWEIDTPLVYGTPANGVSMRPNGQWQWVSGDMNSGATYTTLTYGTKYSALGWTVMPTADGTTFSKDDM
jgi:serine/threonine-protein kinase